MKDFFQRFNRFAVLGLSRDPKAFSRTACTFLASQGCDIYPLNPHTDNIDGLTCYQTVASLPDQVQAAIFFTPPRVTEQLLPQCKERGILDIWFQQGSADEAVLKVAEKMGFNFTRSCVFMHHPAAGFPHNFHRFIVNILGKER